MRERGAGHSEQQLQQPAAAAELRGTGIIRVRAQASPGVKSSHIETLPSWEIWGIDCDSPLTASGVAMRLTQEKWH